MLSTDANSRLKVLKSETFFNVSGFKLSCFNSNDSVRNAINKDGTLSSYDRKTYKSGDGVNTLNTQVSSETVERKFISVTLEITNTDNKGGECYLGFRLYSKDEQGNFQSIGSTIDGDLYSNSEPGTNTAYIAGQNGDSGSFNFVKLAANAQKTQTIGFIVDRDIDVSTLYIGVPHIANAYSYMKIA